jgi:hypothetical protein
VADCPASEEGLSYGAYLRRQNERLADVSFGGPTAALGERGNAGEGRGPERVGFGEVRGEERGGYGLPRLGDVPRAGGERLERVVRVTVHREVYLGTGKLVDVVM